MRKWRTGQETITVQSINYHENWKAHAKCGHQETTAYVAVQTISLGELHPDRALCRAIFPMLPNGHGQYAEAVHYARHISSAHNSGPWNHAVPGTQYACGHILW